MTSETSAAPDPIQLIRSAWQPDDLHRATRLSAQVAAAELLRVRRGVYVDAAAWVGSPPWVRAQIPIAAMAYRRPGSLFCRESALLLHGLPLTTTPAHRTRHGALGLDGPFPPRGARGEARPGRSATRPPGAPADRRDPRRLSPVVELSGPNVRTR